MGLQEAFWGSKRRPGGVLGALGGLLGPPGGLLGSLWGASGAPRGVLGAPRSVLGASWARVGASWGPPGGLLGELLGLRKASWGPLGGLLGGQPLSCTFQKTPKGRNAVKTMVFEHFLTPLGNLRSKRREARLFGNVSVGVGVLERFGASGAAWKA